MHCPYCQQSVTEQAEECPVCGLQMERLDQVLGIPPVLSSGVTDESEYLSGSSLRQVRRDLRQIEQMFPQVRLAVVLAEAPAVVPLSTWCWWLFNRSRFSTALDKGHVNRDVMVVLDPTRHQAALTVGYGLEPFLGSRELALVLEPAAPALSRGDWGLACCSILSSLGGMLRGIVERIPRAYGLPPSVEHARGVPGATPASW